MEKPKCKICGERHWGACGRITLDQIASDLRQWGAIKPAAAALLDRITRPGTAGIGVAVSAEALHQTMAADIPSAEPKPKIRRKPSAKLSEPVPSHTLSHQFAPAGQCAYCDGRRASNAEAVRLHRARKAGKVI